MPTEPLHPPDEAPLDAASLDRLLAHLGTDMVLVGGQALGFWMSRYDIRPSDETPVTNDGDALGDVTRAYDLAEALHGRVDLPPKNSRTSIVAQIRLPVPGGKERNIDVLHKLFTIDGLRKSSQFTERVIRNSVEVKLDHGLRIRVMDPFDVLESRAHNAVGLFNEKGLHVVTQAGWAVQVAKMALRRLVSSAHDDDARPGRTIQRVFRLASSQVGRRLLDECGIEILDAIDTDELRTLAPNLDRQLLAVDALRLERKQPSGTGMRP